MKRINHFFLMSALGAAAFAGNVSICSTGFAVATTSGCGSAITSPSSNNLSADGNWYMAMNSSGTFLSQAFVTVNNAYPVQNAGPWLANNAAGSGSSATGSSWITPGNNQGSAYANGNYYYASSFTVTTPATASLSGFWLADDYGGGIFLNSVSVGQSSLPAFGGLGGPMVPFTISQGNPNLGQAAFTSGQNLLVFGVVNDSTNHGALTGGPTPTGVRVMFGNGGGGNSAVPEPGTMLLMGAGLIGLGVLARRSRKA